MRGTPGPGTSSLFPNAVAPSIQFAGFEALVVLAAVTCILLSAEGCPELSKRWRGLSKPHITFIQPWLHWTIAAVSVAVAASLGAGRYVVADIARVETVKERRDRIEQKQALAAAKRKKDDDATGAADNDDDDGAGSDDNGDAPGFNTNTAAQGLMFGHNFASGAAGCVGVVGLALGALNTNSCWGPVEPYTAYACYIGAALVYMASQVTGKDALALIVQGPVIVIILTCAVMSITTFSGVCLLGAVVVFAGGPEVRKAIPNGQPLSPDDVLHLFLAVGFVLFGLAASSGCGALGDCPAAA